MALTSVGCSIIPTSILSLYSLALSFVGRSITLASISSLFYRGCILLALSSVGYSIILTSISSLYSLVLSLLLPYPVCFIEAVSFWSFSFVAHSITLQGPELTSLLTSRYLFSFSGAVLSGFFRFCFCFSVL